MNSLNWFERRKLKKNVNWFVFQINSENIDLALQFFETKLLQHADFLSKEIRIIYYYYKWYLSDDDQYFEMIESIKISSNLNNAVLMIKEMELSYLHRKIARALKNSNPEELSKVNKLLKIHGENSTLQFSIVLLKFIAWGRKQENNEVELMELNGLLSDLPNDGQIHEVFIPSYYKLLIVLLFHSEQFSALLKLLEFKTAADSFEIKKVLDIKKTILFRQWKLLLSKHDYKSASNTLEQLFNLLDKLMFRNLFASQVIEQVVSPDSTILANMLESCSGNEKVFPNDTWNLSLDYLQILGLLKLRKLVSARNQIDSMLQASSGMDEIHLLQISLKSKDLQMHMLFLKALSYLNETTDWYVKQEPDEEQAVGSLGNFSLWKELSRELDSVIQHAGKVESDYAWKRKILTGLTLFVNTSAAIKNEHIEDFRNAIENISEPGTRQKLQAILGELIIRSKATEEAIDYIKKGNFVQLLELFINVIQPQGNAIPVLIRITVILTLWEKDRSFNALEYLLQIKTDTGEEQYIDKAIQEVKIYELIKGLEHECVSFDEAESLPSMEPLNDAPQIRPLCEMANRVIHLKLQNWTEAKRDVDRSGTEKSSLLERIYYTIQIYSAWKTQDNSQITKYLENGVSNSFAEDANAMRALKVKALLNYIQTKDKDQVLKMIHALVSEGKDISLKSAVISLLVWLLENKQGQVLLLLLEVIHGEENLKKSLSNEEMALLSLMEGMAYAMLKQYNLADKSFQSLRSQNSSDGDIGSIGVTKGWADLFLTYLDLIGLLNAEKDIKIGWSSLKRRVQEQVEGMTADNLVSTHLQLILCLLSFIDDTRIIDDAMLIGFQATARELRIRPKTPFLEELLRNVVLRKKIIEDFWKANSLSDFHSANMIYESELVPMFKENMPYAIQIVKVMIDWNLQNKETLSLIGRLDDIQNRYPEANPEFIKKVRNYINDSNRILELAGILVSHDFENAVKFIQKTEWEGYDPGSMPVQVAIALLFSYYKLQQNENAQRLGELIANSSNLAQWVRDFGNILLGYVCFENKIFGDAAKSFEKISQSTIKGHNVNKYWAASYFSIGLQYIGKGMEGKENEAFDAFARAMSNKETHESNVNLSPLFFHIGLLNLHGRNGSKALASFKLASKTIAGLKVDEIISRLGATAAIGESVCRMFLQSETLSNEGIDEALSAYKIRDFRFPEIIHNYCILHIVTYFKMLKEGTLTIKPLDVKKRVDAKIKELEAIQGELKRQDPVLFIFKAIYLILFEGEKSKPEALKLLGQAQAMGIQSEKLNAFLKKYLSKDEMKKELFETFMLYMTDESVNEFNKDYLILNQPFNEYSKLNKGFVPDEIVVDTCQKTTFVFMKERLQNLKNNLEAKFGKDEEVKKLLLSMNEDLESIEKGNERFSEAEEKLLNILIKQVN